MHPTQAQPAALVLPLDDAGATLERVGGKGASLARLARAGLPVPPGFHLTTDAYRRFVEANDLQERILAAGEGVDPGDTAALERTTAGIQALFAGGTIPDDVAEAVRRAYARLAEAGPGTGTAAGSGEPAVAVRSSATAEDLPEASFAGQQETYLNVRGAAPLLDAVKRCWASLWTGRAIAYRARAGIPPRDVSLAVVVQELVPADAAGVLFTADPVSGARDRVLINAAWGLGEAVVGGLVTPDSLTLDKGTGAVLSQEVADKAVMTVRTPGGTETEPVPEERRRRPSLDPAQAAELARLGTRIEQLWGQPVDVEWALHDGRIAVVQARPITALPEPRAPSDGAPAGGPDGAWALPDPQRKYYRASVVELLPDPVSPLFATFALPRWNAALMELLREAGAGAAALALGEDVGLTTVNGYAFYGWRIRARDLLSLLPATLRLAPFLARARSRWEEEARPAYEVVSRRWEQEDLAGLPAGRLVAGVQDIVNIAAWYYVSIQSGILPGAYSTESLFTTAYDRAIKGPDDPPALTFLLGFDSEPIRAERSLYELAEWARGRQGLAAYLGVTPGSRIADDLGGPAPAGVAEEDWREFGRRFGAHLAAFGHAIYDLDFAKPVPADDPAPLLDTLRHVLAGNVGDPRPRQQAAAARREAATEALRQRLSGPRRALFERLLGPAQRFAPLREDALAGVGRGWPVLRRILRELGRRLVAAGGLAEPDDAFWLTEDELRAGAAALDAGQPVESRQERVAERRAQAAAWRRLTPPGALPLEGGTKIFGVDFSRMMPSRQQEATGDVIRGTGTSPGQVTAPARVLHGPEEFGQMRPGDILVARITTPAWTPLFALAAGVVTDIGGPLSHGSIVAREYHIPAVLGTGSATERIRSGQRIAVDGDAGTVRLLS
jgi:pyruvate,water dikinase